MGARVGRVLVASLACGLWLNGCETFQRSDPTPSTSPSSAASPAGDADPTPTGTIASGPREPPLDAVPKGLLGKDPNDDLSLGKKHFPVPAVVITFDVGGSIEHYASYYADLRERGVPIRIDGYCVSSCTMALASSHVCVTDKAVLGFHSAYMPLFKRFGPRLFDIPASTAILWAHYPHAVQEWITERGGLTATMLYLKGDELRALVRLC